MQGEEHEVTHEVWRFQRAKEKGSFLFLLRLVIMSETSKHFRCLFSTEVIFKDKYIQGYLAGSTQLDSRFS